MPFGRSDEQEHKSKVELEALIHAELNEPTVKVAAYKDPLGWEILASVYDGNAIDLTLRATQIAERLRAQYRLKED